MGNYVCEGVWVIMYVRVYGNYVCEGVWVIRYIRVYG